MNANEHLDFYNPDSIYYANSRHYIQQLENKVRQQQAEIEALKKEAALQRLSDFTQEADNEPVAWMVAEMVFDTEETAIAIGKTYDDAIIPLYTHPVKEQLTDEEIKFIAYPFESVYTTYDKQTDIDTVHTRFDQLGFARAIMKRCGIISGTDK